LTAFALVAALGFSWIIQGIGGLGLLLGGEKRGYPVGICIGTLLFSGLLLWSLYGYSTPRINALHEFNNVRQSVLDSIDDRRQTDEPLLVLLRGELGTVTWRAYGSLMAVTDPHFENDVIGAWQYTTTDQAQRQEILARFPDREVIEMAVFDESAWFIDGVCDPAIINASGIEEKPSESVSVSPDCGAPPPVSNSN